MRRFAKLAACVVASLAFIGTLITRQHVSAQYYDGNRCPSVDPPDHEVRFANPDDCASYFLCSNGIPILQRCPEGLHFNPELCVCDWPDPNMCDPNKPGKKLVEKTCYRQIDTNIPSLGVVFCGTCDNVPNSVGLVNSQSLCWKFE